VIISPGPEDGKTTVAIGLAIAEARAGAQAILVDADLRRPQVSTRLGIPAADGLGAVLLHERELDEVLVEHAVDAPDGGRLLVLPAGPPPANPSALISSPEMRALLRELEGRADLVIIDTAATLAVSDSLPLIQAASGLVMIVRMNRSSRAAVRRLQKVIASTHGTVMGTVATGTGTMTYGYGYYEAGSSGPGGSASRARLGRLLRRKRSRGSIDVSSEAPVPAPGLASEPRLARDAAPTLAPIRRPIPPPPPSSAATPELRPEPTAPALAEGEPGEQSWRQRLSAARKTVADRADRPGR